MPSERVDERLLVKYLLGNLSETEQVDVEDRALADVDYMHALEASEADLIDTYVRGGLSQSERRAFERRFLTSPNRRSKVEFAKALARVASESTEIIQRTPQLSLIGLIRTWSPTLRTAAAFAALFCIAGTSWLILQNASMRSRIGVLEGQRRDLETQEQALRRRLAAEGESGVTAPAAQQPQQQSTGTPVVASLVLLPGLVRAETRVQQLILTPSAQIARIEIHLEARDDYRQFRFELRTRRGEGVLTRGNLARHRTTTGHAVSFDVPASVLKAGEYELTLKGVADGQAVVDIGYYYFNVRKN